MAKKTKVATPPLTEGRSSITTWGDGKVVTTWESGEVATGSKKNPHEEVRYGTPYVLDVHNLDPNTPLKYIQNLIRQNVGNMVGIQNWEFRGNFFYFGVVESADSRGYNFRPFIADGTLMKAERMKYEQLESLITADVSPSSTLSTAVLIAGMKYCSKEEEEEMRHSMH